MKLATLFLLVSTGLLTAQEYYLSNSLAMELGEIEEINKIDEYEWLLQVEKNDGEVRSILYNNGNESKELIKKYNTSGTLVFESEITSNNKKEVFQYRSDGKIEENSFFDSDGILEKRMVYIYSPSGDLLKIETRDNQNILISEMRYNFRSNGSIRSILEYNTDVLTHFESWNNYNSSPFMEQRSDDSSRGIIYYNNIGKVEKTVQFNNDEIEFEKIFIYDSNGIIKSTETINHLTSETVIVSMNKKGQPQKEEVFQINNLVYTVQYKYSGDNLVFMEKRSSGLQEKWIYIYSDDKRTGEEFYKFGSLIHKKKITDSENNSYILELYNNGNAILNLIYENDVKVREEFLKDGRVIRTRIIGEE